MKKIFLFVAAMCCTAVMHAEIPASGKVGTCDFVFDSASGLLTISSSADAPETGGELKIDNPLNSPFAGSEALKEVIVEEGVFEIGTGAFLRCMNLKKITFPSTIGVIGFSSDAYQKPSQNYLPFLGCKNLKTLIIQSHYAPDYDNEIDFNDPANAFDFDPSQVDLLVHDGSIANFVEEGWGVFHICSLPAVAEGTFGDGLAWKLSGDGKLTISGKGEMPDFENVYEQPWNNYIADIKELVVCEGITHIGACAFGFCGFMEKAYLPATLTSIGQLAFGFTPSLTDIVCASIVVPAIEGEYPLFTDDTPRNIYVWEFMLHSFQMDEAWADYDLRTFESEVKSIDKDVEASAQAGSETSLYINWLQVNGATQYIITLTAQDGSFTIEITVNADGNITSYTRRAPAREPRYVLNEEVDGWSLTLNGLESGKQYDITILAKNDEQTLATFHTSTSTFTENIDQISQEPKANSQKLLINGQLLIKRNGKFHTALGTEVR